MRAARRYIGPIARVAALAAACVAALGFVDYRLARASVMDRVLGLGRRMAPYLDDGRATEAPRELHLNGLTMYAAAGHTSHPPAMVRQWYAERYAGRGTAMDVLTRELAEKHLVPPGKNGLTQASFGDDNQGGMAALDLGPVGSVAELATRLAHLGANGLPEGGALRYLYYERTSDGGTRFLTVWSDDRFALSQLIPSRIGDDAPGRDLRDVPRYPGTRRVLSADERGTPSQLAVYAGGGSPELADAFYQARLQTLGWRLDPRFAEVARKEGRHTQRALSADGAHELVVDCSDDRDGRGLTVTAVQLR
jgi:hypothetical protein